MSPTVDLRAVPFRLDDDQVDWVERTLAGLTVEEKVGQLFVGMYFPDPTLDPGLSASGEADLARHGLGGIRYTGGTAAQVQALVNDLQGSSPIPLLVAANPESGGDLCCEEGTYLANGAQCDASDGTEVPYRAGLVGGREASALGVNVAFAPVVDVLVNWRNTVINTRAHGATVDDVLRSTDAQARGLRDADPDLAVCVKHFPGDGTEERDQHLVMGVNELHPEEWDATFGRIYAHHIAAGVEMIMAGHIALPHYSRALDPTLTDADIQPATLSPELIDGLLKTRLGFNGVVMTDASHMIGLTGSMRREDAVPRAIAAGCDMFLFLNDVTEDLGFMMAGVRDGTITPERLDDAVRRVLGLKARLHLPERRARGTLLRRPDALAVVGCEEHLRWRDEAADRCITLVKDTAGVLPLSPRTHRRIRLYYLEGDVRPWGPADTTLDALTAELESRGFEVTLNDGRVRTKGATLAYRDAVDAALVVANVEGYASENNYRIRWRTPLSSDAPWYTREVPTVLVSLCQTTHLHDLTMMRTVVHAYHGNPATLRRLVDKLTGVSPFRGRFNQTVWTDKWQARL